MAYEMISKAFAIAAEAFIDIEDYDNITTDTLYITDPLYKLTRDNLVDTECINGISKRKLIIEMHDSFNNIEFDSYITLNTTILNFLNNLKQ